MGSLSNLYISQSYTSLIHLGSDTTITTASVELQDGLGNGIGVFVNSKGDLNINGDFQADLAKGYVWVGDGSDRTSLVPTSSLVTNVNTSSLVTTASFNSYTQSTNIRLNNLETTSASVNVSISNLNSTTSSFATSITNLNASSASQQVSINALNSATSSYVTDSESGSFLITASFDNGTRNLTFTKGDTTTFNVNIPNVSGSVINTGSFATTGSNTFVGANSFSSSVDILGGLNMYSNGIALGYPKQIGDPYNTNVGIFTPFINASTGSLVLSGNVMAQRGVTVLNGLGVTGSVVISRRLVGMSFTGGDLNVEGTFTSSLQEGYVWVGNSAGITTTVSTSSFGGGGGGLVTTASFNSYTQSTDLSISQLNASSASQQVSINSLNVNSASVNTSISALNTFTSSQQIIDSGLTSAVSQKLFTSSFNAYTSSNNQRVSSLETNSASVNISITNVNSATASLFTSVNSLNSATSSLFQSASLGLVTASVNTNVITFRKGDGTTFDLTIAASGSVTPGTISGSAQITALGFVSSSVTASSLVTASFDNGTRNLTFTKGDATTFNVNIPDVSGSTINTGSFATTGSNTFVGKQIIDGSSNGIEMRGNASFIDLSGASSHISLYSGTGSIRFYSGSADGDGTSNLDTWVNMQVNPSNGALNISSFPSNNNFVDFDVEQSASIFTLPIKAMSGNLDINSGVDINSAELNIYDANPQLQLKANPQGSGSQYPAVNIVVNPNVNPTDIYGGYGILREQDLPSGATFLGMAANSYSSQYSGVTTPMIVAYGNNPDGSDTAIAWTSNGQADHWKKSNFKYGIEVTGSTNIAQLTASLQEGYVWVGNAAGKTTTVATSSFATTIPTGTISSSAQITALGFVNSGSNSFIGNQTITGSLILSSSAAVELQVIGNSVFTGSVAGNVVSASITSNTASIDFNLSNYFEVTSSITPLHLNVTNITPGRTSTLIISASASSSIRFSPNVAQPSGNAYSGSLGSIDILSLVAFNASKVNVVSTKALV